MRGNNNFKFTTIKGYRAFFCISANKYSTKQSVGMQPHANGTIVNHPENDVMQYDIKATSVREDFVPRKSLEDLSIYEGS